MARAAATGSDLALAVEQAAEVVERGGEADDRGVNVVPRPVACEANSCHQS